MGLYSSKASFRYGSISSTYPCQLVLGCSINQSINLYKKCDIFVMQTFKLFENVWSYRTSVTGVLYSVAQSIHLTLILIICPDGVDPNLELITPEVDVTSEQLRQKMAPAQLPLSARTPITHPNFPTVIVNPFHLVYLRERFNFNCKRNVPAS